MSLSFRVQFWPQLTANVANFSRYMQHVYGLFWIEVLLLLQISYAAQTPGKPLYPATQTTNFFNFIVEINRNSLFWRRRFGQPP